MDTKELALKVQYAFLAMKDQLKKANERIAELEAEKQNGNTEVNSLLSEALTEVEEFLPLPPEPEVAEEIAQEITQEQPTYNHY